MGQREERRFGGFSTIEVIWRGLAGVAGEPRP
jgi:hypothetical protein